MYILNEPEVNLLLLVEYPLLIVKCYLPLFTVLLYNLPLAALC